LQETLRVLKKLHGIVPICIVHLLLCSLGVLILIGVHGTALCDSPIHPSALLEIAVLTYLIHLEWLVFLLLNLLWLLFVLREAHRVLL
jgi:hypothetical protein